MTISGKWYNLLKSMSLKRRLTMATLPFFGNPLIILNPAANRGKMDKYRTLVLDRVKLEQARYVETTKQGEAKELAMIAAKQSSPVIIVGGDGSVHEVVNGILSSGSRVPLGIIGAGSGNDFAWNTLNYLGILRIQMERHLIGHFLKLDAALAIGG